MGIHKSLVLKSRLRRARSVLSRAERLEVLQELGKWKEGDSVFGLPKVRSLIPKAKKKKKEVKAVDGAAVPVAGAPGAAPAAGASAPAASAAPAKKGDDRKK